VKVHLYGQCWNEADMLPFFFRHYDPLVDHYFMYDDGSDDETWSMLEDHPRVTPRRFEQSDPDSFVLSEQKFSNQCWKESRGRADWVVVTEVDEHLFHPQWADYLASCAAAGVTLIPALGFQILSERPPAPDEVLTRDYHVGAPWIYLMKPSIFDPVAITEINYKPGRHQARPRGRVVVPELDEMLLFHYKYLGFQRTLERHRMLLTGLGSRDLEEGWGRKYTLSEEELREDWDTFARDAVDAPAVVRDPGWRYPIRPWWEKFRR
jgi:hypothetical protein